VVGGGVGLVGGGGFGGLWSHTPGGSHEKENSGILTKRVEEEERVAKEDWRGGGDWQARKKISGRRTAHVEKRALPQSRGKRRLRVHEQMGSGSGASQEKGEATCACRQKGVPLCAKKGGSGRSAHLRRGGRAKKR